MSDIPVVYSHQINYNCVPLVVIMHKNRLAWRVAKQLLLLQSGLTAALSLGAWLFFGSQSGYSALLGGMVSVIPGQIFAYRLFKYSGAQATKQIMRSFYSGELLKILSSIFLFVIVFATVKVSALAFFMTFIIIQMSHWVAPLLFANELTKVNRIN